MMITTSAETFNNGIYLYFKPANPNIRYFTTKNPDIKNQDFLFTAKLTTKILAVKILLL